MSEEDYDVMEIRIPMLMQRNFIPDKSLLEENKRICPFCGKGMEENIYMLYDKDGDLKTFHRIECPEHNTSEFIYKKVK